AKAAAYTLPAPKAALNDAEMDILLTTDRPMLLAYRSTEIAMTQLRIALEVQGMTPADLLNRLEEAQAAGDRVVAPYLDLRVKPILERLEPVHGKGADALQASQREIAALRHQYAAIRERRLTNEDRDAMAMAEAALNEVEQAWRHESAMWERTGGAI